MVSNSDVFLVQSDIQYAVYRLSLLDALDEIPSGHLTFGDFTLPKKHNENCANRQVKHSGESGEQSRALWWRSEFCRNHRLGAALPPRVSCAVVHSPLRPSPTPPRTPRQAGLKWNKVGLLLERQNVAINRFPN